MLNEMNIPLEEDGIEEEILVDEEVTITKAMWGDIGGNIANQTDLQNALDAKQDSLTEAQLNAVNSGITAEKVTTYDGYADQIASKANQSALNAEATTRQQADTALGRRIDDEATARQQADNGLQTQIDAITSKSDVVDVVANYAALQAYDTSTLGNNDVIKVLDDETHEDALTYYRWSTTTQTWSYIGQEAPYYSKGQMDVKLAEKQDKLTAGANIQIQNGTISATDTTYTAGSGLNLNGTEFSADTTVLATKSDLDSYYTKTETDTKLAPKLEAEVVAELPATGTEGKLYLTPKAHTTQTATGNPITATVAEEAGALESFQLDGDTFQQSYEGKNLFNSEIVQGYYAFANGNYSSNSNSYVTNKNKISVTAGQTYTISANKGIYDGSDYTGAGVVFFNNGTYVSSELRPANGTFTVPSGANQVVYNFYKGTSDTSIVPSDITWVQLESGSSATTYEPYVGGVPSPNPSYPQAIQTVTGEQTVEVVGKNLFDTTNADIREQYILNDSGVEVSDRSGGYTRNYSKVMPETTYILSGLDTISGKTRRVYYYDKDKTFISRSEQITTGSPTLAFTTPANCYFVNIQIYYPNDTDTSAWQLELGSTVSSYTPYSKQTLPISLGTIELCKLGTYQDYIWKDGDEWKVHKATGKHLFNGGETFTSDGSSQGIYQFRWTDESVLNNSNQTITLTASDKFMGVIWNGSWNKDFSVVQVVLQTALRFMTSLSSSVEEFKTWLSSNNTVVYYVLATATDTTITDQTLIAQLEAIRTASLQASNTITNTATGSNLAGDMELGYYEYDPTNRYDKWLWLDLNNNYEKLGS